MTEKGNAAVKKYDKHFYSQWERQKGLATPGGQTNSSKTFTTSFSVGGRPLSNPPTRSSRIRTSKATERDSSEERKRLLELKIMSTKSSITSFKLRESELIRENIAMKEAIDSLEKPHHEAVKQLLRRYEKFRGGMTFLCENFTTTLQSEQELLKKLSEQLEQELALVQKEVDILDNKLKQKQNEVHVLNNYKDKEYPVKAIQIAELMAELDQQEIENVDELDDLERIIDTELHKLIASGNQAEADLKESALTKVLQQMHPSLKDMAEQNQVMLKEIDFHTSQITQLQTEIEDLKEQVKDLVSHPKTNVRLQVFPELFKYETICTPDMDVILDIPTVEILPI